VWIAHPNGEWTNYSHIAHDPAKKAGLKVGDWVKAGQYLGDEGAVGRAMLLTGQDLADGSASTGDTRCRQRQQSFLRRSPTLAAVGIR
jgi:hypothetical protein